VGAGALIANHAQCAHWCRIGRGISAPALGQFYALATATDEFLKYAIKNGREMDTN